jgi:DNA-binding FadR family transcriptional regulator
MADEQRQSGKRLYEKVAATLAADIKKGSYEIGDRLPSERVLASKFGVSRPTMREAVIALEVDGLVEVRTGSGVYVKSTSPTGGAPHAADMGMFELLEARRAFESEAAALAAARISDEELAALRGLVDEMAEENKRDVELSEDADRRFHMGIAAATGNSAIVRAIEMFWDARQSSHQTQHFLKKVRAGGVAPRIDEHAKILTALEKRDPEKARAAMVDHLTAVIEAVLEATEVEALERTRAEIKKQRQLYLEGA